MKYTDLLAIIPCPFPDICTTSKLDSLVFNGTGTGSGIGPMERRISTLGTIMSSSNNDGWGLLLRITIFLDLCFRFIKAKSLDHFYKVIIIILNVINSIIILTLGTSMCNTGSSLNKNFVITSGALAMSQQLSD